MKKETFSTSYSIITKMMNSMLNSIKAIVKPEVSVCVCSGRVFQLSYISLSL